MFIFDLNTNKLLNLIRVSEINIPFIQKSWFCQFFQLIFHSRHISMLHGQKIKLCTTSIGSFGWGRKFTVTMVAPKIGNNILHYGNHGNFWCHRHLVSSYIKTTIATTNSSLTVVCTWTFIQLLLLLLHESSVFGWSIVYQTKICRPHQSYLSTLSFHYIEVKMLVGKQSEMYGTGTICYFKNYE